MSVIRLAAEKGIDAVAAIFERIIDDEEKGLSAVGWKRGVYPTKATAEAALAQGDLFVLEDGGRVVAAMRINHEQVPEYSNCRWDYPASNEQIMVAHTLVITMSVSSISTGGSAAAA